MMIKFKILFFRKKKKTIILGMIKFDYLILIIFVVKQNYTILSFIGEIEYMSEHLYKKNNYKLYLF